MSKNSIIDNQEDADLSMRIELDKLTDPENGMHYFYLNYIIVNGKNPVYQEKDKLLFDFYMKVQKEGKNILLL
jgi:hypothetical protein